MRFGHVAVVGLHAVAPLLSVGPATAADIRSGQDANTAIRLAFVGQNLAEWKVVLGGGAKMVPEYEGSDEFKIEPIPFVSATFGERVTVTPRGVLVDVYSFNNLRVRGLLGYETGRKQQDSDHLRGLGDIDMGGAVGGTVSYRMGPAELYATLSRTIGGSEGLEARLGLDLSHQFDRFRFSARASATWADAATMTTYFGITAAQAARSGLPQYDIGAGFKRFDLDLSVTYSMTEHWLVRGQIGIGYLLGEAADSPIVQEALQPSVMVTLGYRF